MKKTYIQPHTLIVKISLHSHLMSTSTIEVYSDEYDEENMTDLVKEQTWPKNSVWEEEW